MDPLQDFGYNPLLVSQERYDQRLPVAQFYPTFAGVKLPWEILGTLNIDYFLLQPPPHQNAAEDHTNICKRFTRTNNHH